MLSHPNQDAIADAREDSHLIERLKAGGRDELSKLFDRLRPNLKAIVGARLDPRLRSRIDESDIVQEIYLRAASNLPNYLLSPNVHPVVWLRIISKHLVAETHRRHFRIKRSPLREIQPQLGSSDKLVTHIAASIQPVQTKVAHEELLLRIHAMLKSLRDTDREILEMRHTQELSISEIAGLLDSSYEATKKRYYRALARFRLYAKELIEDGSDTKVTPTGQIKR